MSGEFYRPLPAPVALPNGELAGWVVVAMAARDSVEDAPSVLLMRVVNPATRTSAFYHVPVAKDSTGWYRRPGPCQLTTTPPNP